MERQKEGGAECAYDGCCEYPCGGTHWAPLEYEDDELEEGEVVYVVVDETKEAGDGE